MNRRIPLIVTMLLILAATFTVYADKPVDSGGVPFGNGFPSGAHFNLNIIGKRDNFVCTPAEYEGEPPQQVYGNVIYIPREQGDDPITIQMESGKKGPKGAQGITELQVTDWCSESFPDSGENSGDEASLRLPKNDNGYAVYARITGKPGENGEPTVTITPDLFYVEDETGHDMIMLGLVDPSGVFTWNGTTLERTSAGNGRGSQKATWITPLFHWTGLVCYIQDWATYCADPDSCSSQYLCCTDLDSDGVYDECDDTAVGDADQEVWTCPLGGEVVEAHCRQHDDTWVFNIADFVGYLWDLDSTGAYVVQVRFYPL
jgi:hypothetical protein